MYDLYFDIKSTSFQTSDGNVFKMAASSTEFIFESSTILEFFHDFKKLLILELKGMNYLFWDFIDVKTPVNLSQT